MLVDHEDRMTHNNHPSNLRLATHSQNQQNSSRKYSTQRTLPKGVSVYYKCLHKAHRYAARIHHNGAKIMLGVFDTPEEAHRAYAKAAARFFGDFACIG